MTKMNKPGETVCIHGVSTEWRNCIACKLEERLSDLKKLSGLKNIYKRKICNAEIKALILLLAEGKTKL